MTNWNLLEIASGPEWWSGYKGIFHFEDSFLILWRSLHDFACYGWLPPGPGEAFRSDEFIAGELCTTFHCQKKDRRVLLGWSAASALAKFLMGNHWVPPLPVNRSLL